MKSLLLLLADNKELGRRLSSSVQVLISEPMQA